MELEKRGLSPIFGKTWSVPYFSPYFSWSVPYFSEKCTDIARDIRNIDPGFSTTKFAATQPYRNQKFLDEFVADLHSAVLTIITILGRMTKSGKFVRVSALNKANSKFPNTSSRDRPIIGDDSRKLRSDVYFRK